MKKVLIITFWYPPVQAIAALRARGLAKYLPEFGWAPIVLVPKLPSQPPNYNHCTVIETPYRDIISEWKKRLGFRPDENVTQTLQIGSGLEIKKPFLYGLRKLFLAIVAYPDREKGWHPFALHYAREIMRKERVDAILSTSPPETTHLVAHHIKQEFKVPWVADLRDLWTQNHYYLHGHLRRLVERRLERKILGSADALVTVSMPLAERLKTLHQNHRVYSITNGFDVEELAPENMPLTQKFTITYAGQLYEGRRDPRPLFEALKFLIQEGKLDISDIEVRFYGPIEEWLAKQVKTYELSNVVTQYGVVPREIALKAQRESHLLLLLTWNDPRERGVYTGKVFEYLAARRPILAIGGSGVVIDLLKETKAGVYAATVLEIKQFLTKAYRHYKQSGRVPYEGQIDAIMHYTHQRMAEQFAEVLEEVCEITVDCP